MTAPDSFDSPDGRTYSSAPETAGQAAPCEPVDEAIKAWLNRRTDTALAAAGSGDLSDYERGVRQGIEQLRYLHLDDYWYTLTPAILEAIAAAAPAPAGEGARPLEQLAIAAYGAWIGQTSAERVLLSWRQGNTDREAWRAAADAVRMMLDMPAHTEPQPQAAPGLGTAWRLLNETRDKLGELADEMVRRATAADMRGHADSAQALNEYAGRIRMLLPAVTGQPGTEGQ